MSSLSRLVLLASLVVTGCGGGGGGGAADPDAQGSDDPGGDDPTLVDQVGCHMLQDSGSPFAVPPEDGATAPVACVVLLGPQLCFARNTECFGGERVMFEWQPGSFYNVKAFEWSVVSASAGEVTTETNADSGILGVPPSTTVTAAITHDASGVTYDFAFRMEDDFVVFEKVDPPGGW